MAHGIVRTDNMSGTTLGKDLVSIKYMPSDVATAIDNGNVVVIGDYISGEVRKGSTPAVDSALGSIALIASEEIDKAKTFNTLADFQNKAGALCRGYHLRSGDTFSVTADAITGTAAEGSIIELQAGTKLKAVDSLTSGSTKVGEVVDIEGIWIVIEVA